jgi:glyoxylase-like metal-dependent hydrolase (beta-lactamase superfamily II)
LRVLTGGETVAFDSAGTFEVAYTPGHASHHVSYLHDGTAFVGDVGGVQIAPGTPAIPPTPPPDVDIELWKESIALVRGWKPERLAMTHFGDATDVDEHLSDVEERLSRWSELARHGDEAAFITAIRAEIAAEVPPEIAAAFEQAAPADQLYAGYARYWHKRSEHRAEQGAERGS